MDSRFFVGYCRAAGPVLIVFNDLLHGKAVHFGPILAERA